MVVSNVVPVALAAVRLQTQIIIHQVETRTTYPSMKGTNKDTAQECSLAMASVLSDQKGRTLKGVHLLNSHSIKVAYRSMFTTALCLVLAFYCFIYNSNT